jgi:hypothetical protein
MGRLTRNSNKMKSIIAIAIIATLGIAHAGERESRHNTESRSTMNTRINLQTAQRQAQGQQQSLRNNNKVNVDGNNAAQTSQQAVSIHNPRMASSAFAASIPPTTVCAGSTSGGASGASFSLSVGTSWTDSNCVLLEQVRTVAVVLGQEAVAQEMLCAVTAYAEARARVGDPCVTPTQPTVTPVKQGDYTDPIIRHRLGLQPLKG